MKSFLLIGLFSIALFALSACASDQDRATRECEQLGYTPGDDAFLGCYQAVMQRYQNAYMGLIGLGTQMMTQP